MNWLLAHFIGDYIIQNDYLAAGKKKSHWICLLHAVTYLIPFLFCGFTWWQLTLIGAQHFLQDRWGFVIWFMKVTGHEQFSKPPCGPWSIFLTDNLLHVIWIMFVVWLPFSGIL